MKRIQWLLGAVLVVFLLTLPVFSQEPAKSSSDQAAQTQAAPSKQASNPNFEKQMAQSEEQLAEQSREAAGENDENTFKHSPSVQFVAKHLGISVEAGYWVLIVLNFAIVAGLITWFWKSKMPAAFRSRTDSILKSMEMAKQASDDASRRLKDVESRLARLDTEISQMRATADAAAREEELRVRQAVEDEKQRIIEAAEQEIDAAARSARAELKGFAAELAVALAEKQIRIDTHTDQALVRGFGKQLADSSRNGSGKESS